MITNSSQGKKIASFSLNESPIEKSIIAHYPNQSIDVIEKMQTLNLQVERLNAELRYYKAESLNKSKNGLRTSKESESRIGHLQNEISKLTFENQQQKDMIAKLSEDLRYQKRQSHYGDQNLIAECEKLQMECDRYREDNLKKTKQIKELQFELAEAQLMNKRNEEIIEIQKQELSIKSREGSSEQLRLKNLELEYKISQLNQEISDNMREIDSLNSQIDKLKKQNVIDRDSRNRRTFDNLRVIQGSRSRYSGASHSRVSDLEMLDNQRLTLKIAEKNKEYEMLYFKYQSLENDYNSLEEINQQLVRQQKMLAERLSSFQIHTEGDEVVGELENKLVLMSTELMRLGNLSRTKVQESKELNIRIKELLLRNEHLEKDMIEKDKMLLNYKEEIRLMELRINDITVSESRVKEDKQAKQKYDKLGREIQKITALYRQKIQALKNADIKNAILQQKNTRLTHQYEQLERENKSLLANQDKTKSNTTKILNQQAEINFYKENNTALKEEIKRMEQKIYESRIQVQRMSRERQEGRNSSNIAMERLAAAQEELRRINIRYEEKEMELREINHKNEERIIMKNNQIKKLEERLSLLDKQNQRNSRVRSELPKFQQLLKQIQRLEAKQLSLKLQLSNYQEKIALLAQQNQRLSFLVQKKTEEEANVARLRADLEQKDKRIRQLQRDNQSLSVREKRHREDNQNLRLKLRDFLSQEREAQSWQFKNRQLRDEIDALKTQLSVKQQQLHQIDDRYQRECVEKNSLIRMNQQLSSKINISYFPNDKENPDKQYFQKELKKYIQKTQRDAITIRQLSQKDQQHQEIYVTFSSEIMRLNQVVADNTEKMAAYKKQIDFLQHKVATCEESLQSKKHINFASEKSIGDGENKAKLQILQAKVRGYQSEIELYKQRCNGMKETNNNQQYKISELTREKGRLQSKLSEVEYQISLKTQNFRTVEDSFKLTILEIKSSNQRLEQSLRQIQNHYISKLDSKEQEVDSLRRQKRQYQNQIYQLEKKISNLQISFGSELNEKNKFISNLSSNHNQTKEEIEAVKKIKNDYEVKVALLSQEIERLNTLRERQTNQIETLRSNLKQNEQKYVESMKDSSYNSQTIDTLSQQIERLNTVLLKNIEQAKEYQRKVKNLETENNELKRQQRQIKQRNQHLERTIIQEKDSFSDKIIRYEEINKELKFELQEKGKECERISQRIRSLQDRQQSEHNSHMKNLYEEMKLLRESNQNLEQKLSLITRQYEQLVQQLEYYKKSKSTADEDEKLRIINNYETTIKLMKEDNVKIIGQKNKCQYELDKVTQTSHEIQERYKISEEKAKTFEEKSRRLEERLKVLEERARSQQQVLRGRSSDKGATEQKLASVMDEMGRLQLLLKSKEGQIQRLQAQVKKSREMLSVNQHVYYSQQKLTEKNGIFIINQASQIEQRSRSASGNNPQHQLRHSNNQLQLDLQHRYELLESVNKKLSTEVECLRKKNVQYEFKMNKLKEEFDIINRLIHQYREENDKLKGTNKILSAQTHQRTNNLISAHSHFSSPQHSSIKNSYYESNIKIGYNHSSIAHQKSNLVETVSKLEKEESFGVIKAKLLEQIDRLSKVNGSLQGEVHQLRLNSSENISLRKRYEQNLAMMMLLFVQIQALRSRVSDNERRQISPRK